LSRRLPQTPLASVANHCAADLLCGREPRRDRRAAGGKPFGAGEALNQNRAPRTSRPLSGGQEFRTRLQTLDLYKGVQARPSPMSGRSPALSLGGQLLTALAAAAGDDLAAVPGGHAGTPTVATGAHKAARLKSALHERAPGVSGYGSRPLK